MIDNDATTLFMALAGIVAGAGLILLEIHERRRGDGTADHGGLRLFRFRINRWLVGLAGIAVGLFLLLMGPQ